MAGLRAFVKELGAIRDQKTKLFAIERERQLGRGTNPRPTRDLLELIDTKLELQTVVKVLAR